MLLWAPASNEELQEILRQQIMVERFVSPDWPNTEEHQQWLQTASDKEIADWIQEQA